MIIFSYKCNFPMNLMSVSLPKTREVGALVYSQPLVGAAPSWNLHPGFVRFRRAKDGHCHKYIEDLCTKKNKKKDAVTKRKIVYGVVFFGVLQSFLGGALHLLTLEGHERLLRVVQRLKLCPKLHKTLLTKWFSFLKQQKTLLQKEAFDILKLN